MYLLGGTRCSTISYHLLESCYLYLLFLPSVFILFGCSNQSLMQCFPKRAPMAKSLARSSTKGLYAPLLKQHRKIEKYRVALTFSRFSLKSLIKHSEHFMALTFAPLSQSAGHSCISKMKSGSKRRSAYSPHGLAKFSLQPHVQIAV